MPPWKWQIIESSGQIFSLEVGHDGGANNMLPYSMCGAAHGIICGAHEHSNFETAKSRPPSPPNRVPSIVPRRIFNTTTLFPPSSTTTVQQSPARISLAPSPPPAEMRHPREPRDNSDDMMLDDSSESDDDPVPPSNPVTPRRARPASPPRKPNQHDEDDEMRNEDEPEQHRSGRQRRERRDNELDDQPATNPPPNRKYRECPQFYQNVRGRNLTSAAIKWYFEVIEQILKDELARCPEIGTSNKGDRALRTRMNVLIFKLSCSKGTTLQAFGKFYNNPVYREKLDALEKRVLKRTISRDGKAARPNVNELKAAAMRLGMTEEQVNRTTITMREAAGDKRPVREEEEDEDEEDEEDQGQGRNRRQTGEATSSQATPRKRPKIESHMSEEEIYRMARLLRKMRPGHIMKDVYEQMSTFFPGRKYGGKEWEELHSINLDLVSKKVKMLKEDYARRERANKRS